MSISIHFPFFSKLPALVITNLLAVSVDLLFGTLHTDALM